MLSSTRATTVAVLARECLATLVSASATTKYPYVMGQMAVEACAAAVGGARLPARVDAPIALLTKDNVGPAIAAFPRPFQRYTDPFSRLVRRHR